MPDWTKTEDYPPGPYRNVLVRDMSGEEFGGKYDPDYGCWIVNEPFDSSYKAGARVETQESHWK